LTAIESFVRSTPIGQRAAGRVRRLHPLQLSHHGQFVTMAEELRLVDTYLDLERPASATDWP